MALLIWRLLTMKLTLFSALACLVSTPVALAQGYVGQPPNPNCYWTTGSQRWSCPQATHRTTPATVLLPPTAWVPATTPVSDPRDHRGGYRELDIASDTILETNRVTSISLGGHYFVHELTIV